MYKTKPNHNQRLLNLLPPPHQMFMVYSKPGVSMESLRDSLFFFFARKIRYLAHWRNHSALWGFPWHESRYGSEICLSCFNLNSPICFLSCFSFGQGSGGGCYIYWPLYSILFEKVLLVKFSLQITILLTNNLVLWFPNSGAWWNKDNVENF